MLSISYIVFLLLYSNSEAYRLYPVILPAALHFITINNNLKWNSKVLYFRSKFNLTASHYFILYKFSLVLVKVWSVLISRSNFCAAPVLLRWTPGSQNFAVAPRSGNGNIAWVWYTLVWRSNCDFEEILI